MLAFSNTDAKHYIVSGLVQGVGYRWFVKKRAVALGITGWVRNRSNGTVEIYAQAPQNILKDFEDILRIGPPGSRVQDILSESRTCHLNKKGFEITY